MYVLINTTDIEVWQTDSGDYGVLPKKHTLANKINQAYGGYYGESVKKGEEPVFYISQAKMTQILNSGLLPVKIRKLMAKLG